jgi:GxxExxY protein
MDRHQHGPGTEHEGTDRGHGTGGTAGNDHASARSDDAPATPSQRGFRDPALLHGRTTTAILSAAHRVHGALGPGLLERVYHSCLCHELGRAGIPFQSEKLLPVRYDGLVIDVGYCVDLIVEDRVIVEVKSVDQIHPLHEAQLLSYLRLSGLRVGLLLNFNVKYLGDGITRRIVD